MLAHLTTLPQDGWYYILNGHQEGPVSIDALVQLARSGQLRPHDYIWGQGMSEWQRAVEVLKPRASERTAADRSAQQPRVTARQPYAGQLAEAAGAAHASGSPRQISQHATHAPAPDATHASTEALVRQQQHEALYAEQRAAEQRAAEQRAAEQRAAEQRAAEQRAAEQRAAEQRAAEQRAAEQRAAEQRAAEQRAAEQRAAEQRAADERAMETLRQEAHAQQQRTLSIQYGDSSSGASGAHQRPQVVRGDWGDVHLQPPVNQSGALGLVPQPVALLGASNEPTTHGQGLSSNDGRLRGTAPGQAAAQPERSAPKRKSTSGVDFLSRWLEFAWRSALFFAFGMGAWVALVYFLGANLGSDQQSATPDLQLILIVSAGALVVSLLASILPLKFVLNDEA